MRVICRENLFVMNILPIVLVLLSASCAVVPQSTAPVAPTPTPEPIVEVPPADFPPQVLYRLLVAELAGQRGQLEVAVGNYLAAAKEARDPAVAERAARIAAFAQALPEALEAASLWVELDPKNPQAYQTLAPLLLVFGRASEATQHYERFITLSAKQPDHGFMQIAGQLARDKNAVAAWSVMNQLLEKWRDFPYAWLARGQLAMRQTKLGLALESVDKALALKSHWASGVVLRARILSLQGNKDDALTYLEDELNGDLEGDVVVHLAYARLLAEARQLDKARAEFERLVELAPRNIEVLYTAGVLALQLDDIDQAERRLIQVLRLGQRMLAASYYLGRVYEQKNNRDAALKYYLAVRHGEYYLSAQSRAADLFAEMGRLEQARDHLHSLRTASSEERVQLYLVESELLRKAEKYQEALDFLSAKLEERPDDTSLRYARALMAEQLDKLDLTERDLRTIIEREPSNAQALNALGYTLADRTERLDEALGFIQRALEVEPTDAAIIDSMGWVQYRLGNHVKAVELLRRALDLIDDPEVAAHLGEVLWEMGDKKDALDVLETALKKNPKHKALLKIMERLGL
jgi:tetratricopeptide (TPR) repeat protein